MSAHGRPRPDPGHSGDLAPLLWALLVIAAALVGGLAAAALVHTSLLIAVLVAVVAGVIAVVVFRSPARTPAARPPAEHAEFPTPPAHPAPASPARPAPSAAPAAAVTVPAPARPETVVQLLPLQGENNSRAAGQSWWDAAAGAPPPSSAAARRAPAPDLSTYMASTFIAQCPRCGAFRLDFRPAQNGWDFRCESCQYVWAWQPGSPWPPVRVKPRRRRE